jgi:carbonic anhydrase
MNKIITVVLLSFLLASNSYAASWTKLQDNKHATLMLDKQSITESAKYQKAWVKINYKAMQTNIQYPEKSYNNAKLLWYFNCAEQKSATAQVYQLLNDEQIFSAAIDIKRARFLEPVPETEIDIAMRYVCKQKAYREAVQAKIEAARNKHEQEKADKKDEIEKPVEQKVTVPEKPAKAVEEEAVGSDKVIKEEGVESEKTPETAAEKKKDVKKQKDSSKKLKKTKSDKGDEHSTDGEKHASTKKKKQKAVHWTYAGEDGPEFWGELSSEYASCKTGRNQSPIDISKTTITTLKPLKTFQRFPAVDIINNGHTIQASFKPGNIMAVDGVMFQMKQMNFHAPSENQIMGKSYPLEAHFVHADPNGNLAVLAVMYEEGVENKALAKLWKQMPKTKMRKPKKLKSKVLAGQLIPRKKMYYRFSGSLTTPPCSEGVIWVVMKETMTASKAQIEAFKKVMKRDNNRPVQPLNGRIVIE